MTSSGGIRSQREIERLSQRIRKELLAGIGSFIGVILTGTSWYWWIEKWSLPDSLYMTIITLSTVGFGEIHPLTQQSRLFTITLILMGLFNIGYIVNRVTEALIQGYFQQELQLRQKKRLLDKLSEHYVLCGFGRTGQQIAKEFDAEGIPFVIVDSNIDSILLAQQLGYIYIQGDATLDETLLQVAIDRAICLVAALPSDAENLYTVLSAKTLNTKVRTIARASTEEAVQKLQRGGADVVVSPYITGGKRMAAAALRPQVMDFVDGIIAGADRAFYLEEFLLDPASCPFVGQSLREAKLRSQSGALVLAIRREDGTLIGGPTADTELIAGDSLICMGTAEQLQQLNRILGPMQGQRLRRPKQAP